jgi:CRISPR-associated protein Cst2
MYAIEVLSSKLNGSSDTVEEKKAEFDNVSYVKKIDGRGVVSAPCQKYNIQRFMQEAENMPIGKRLKKGTKVTISADPYKYVNEDIFGFMRADSISITEEEYDQLDAESKVLFTRDSKKGYKQNITKKRKSRFQLSPLINMSNRKIDTEWNICSTESDSMPYENEIYSGIFAAIGNVNIDDISSFKISDITSEFRDYAVEEGRTEKELKISKNEKYKRIESAIKGLQHLSIEGNQNNYLTDTTPKIVMLGEYSWGNNIFQGVIKENGIDIDALKEALDENEEFRKSDVWIGISDKIVDPQYKGVKKTLTDKLEDYKFVHVDSVKNTFDEYLKYLKNTL